MQRFLALLMVFVLLTGVLMGCTPNQSQSTSPNTQPTTQKPEATTAPPTTVPPTQPTDPTEPTDPPQPPQQDFFTRHGHDVPVAEQIPDYAQPTDTPNLYTLNLDLPDSNEIGNVMVYGNTLYVSYWLEYDMMAENLGLRTYDLTTGNMLYDTTYRGWSEFGPLKDGGFWVLEIASMTLSVYDAAGQATTVSITADSDNPAHYINDACVDPNGQYLVLLTAEGAPVVIHDLKTGDTTVPEFPEQTYFYTVQYQQDGFILNDFSDDIYWLDPTTGEFDIYAPAISCDGLQGTLGYQTYSGGVVLAGLDGDPICYFMTLEGGQWLADLSHGCAALSSYETGPVVHVMDLRNQLQLAAIAFPDNCYGTTPLFLDNGNLLIMTTGEDGSAFYLYETAAPVPDAPTFTAYQYTYAELEAETDRIAQEVFDTTGIELLYGSRGNDFILFDYVGLAELEPITVFRAVNQVAQILGQYPDGMLREAWDCGYDGLQIYLCGTIYGIYSGALDSAGGVTSDVGNYIVIAVDVNNPIDSVLPHELSHVFDRRINRMIEETDWMAVWEAFTPFKKAYIHSYDNYYNYLDYTPDGETDLDDVWFVDSYGRTFPTEDRAKIMEVLWNSGETPDRHLDYPHLLEKARLYCYILRQCFPSCNGEEAPFWERFLGVIDESVLP